MLLWIQKYHYTIQDKPGKDMILANCLSQLPSTKESLPIPIHQNIQHVQLSTHELEAVKEAIQCNPVYNTLYWLFLRGWSNCLRLVLRIAQHYWGVQEELSIEASILLKGYHICISPQLLDRTLADLHSAHQGIEKMQALAQAVYWPGMDADITNYVKRCAICTWYKTSHLLSKCFSGICPMAHGRK